MIQTHVYQSWDLRSDARLSLISMPVDTHAEVGASLAEAQMENPAAPTVVLLSHVGSSMLQA